MKFLYILLATVVFMLTSSEIWAGYATGGVVIKKRNSLPNIIFLSIDDAGQEAYGSLDSPYKADADSKSFTPSGELLEQPVFDTPGMDRLMSLGITFTGAWAGAQCGPSRAMISSGSRSMNAASITNAETTKRRIQEATDESYVIFGGGKSQLGRAAGNPADTSPTCEWGTNGPNENMTVGEQALGYSTTWDDTYPYITCGTDPSNKVATNGTYTPSDPLEENSDYVYMDEAITDQAINFIKTQSFGGNSTDGVVSNHTAKPFIVAIGYHSTHQDSMQDLSEFDGNRVVFDSVTRGVSGVDNLTATFSERVAAGLDIQASLGLPGQGPWTFYCPNYPMGDRDAWANNDAGTTGGGKTSVKSWASCLKTKQKFVDKQIERFLDQLGIAGIKNTLIVFTGDNGSLADQLSARAGLFLGADDFIPDESAITDYAGTPSCAAGKYCGKMSVHETGINVPFIMAGGPIDASNRGTTSKLRILNTDVAETLIQTVVPSGSDYTPDGRDFSSVYSADCGAGSCDTIAGSDWNVTVSQASGEGDIAAIYKLLNGKSFRLMRFPDRCDYVQDLNAANHNSDLRDDIGEGVDSDLDTAWTAMNSALTSLTPTSYSENGGGGGC